MRAYIALLICHSPDWLWALYRTHVRQWGLRNVADCPKKIKGEECALLAYHRGECITVDELYTGEAS